MRDQQIFILVEHDVLYDRAFDAQQLLPYPRTTHAVP
jgi:hypothetical protein